VPFLTLGQAPAIIDRFSGLKALVVGDLMLDHFIWGSVSRISPEAPVPVVEVTRDSEMPGGAGNVAANMASLGADVFLAGLLGDDEAGDRLLARLSGLGTIRTDHTVRAQERTTSVKTRIIAQHQQMVRFDRESKGEPHPDIQKQLWQRIEAVLPEAKCIVVSDYAKGVVSARLFQKLLPAAKKRGIPVIVDPKIENFGLYRNVTCITPNQNEALGGAGRHHLKSEEDLLDVGRKLIKKLNLKSLLITRGERGMTLFERAKTPVHIPTRAREVFDVTGAGDTVIGTLALALAAGAPARVAAELANYAAGIVVGKIGTASVTQDELRKAVSNGRV